MTPKDLELIERIIYKGNDDISISITRSFERLEERIDASKARIYSRLSELEDKLPEIGNADHPIRQAAIAIIEQVLEKELDKEIEGEEYYRLEDKLTNIINETFNKNTI